MKKVNLVRLVICENKKIAEKKRSIKRNNVATLLYTKLKKKIRGEKN